MRGAAGLLLAALVATPAAACDGQAIAGSTVAITAADGPVAAWYEDPTTRYAHAVLGDGIEAGTLAVRIAPCSVLRVTLPEAEVFEDLAPRLADLDGDGRAEIIVVQSHRDLGARLAIYAVTGASLTLAAATPHIGQPHRWLAPVGAADLDGDGATEIAYIDRPHLARILRVWRYRDGRLREIASLDGLTNHRRGAATIPGGLRDCGQGPEIITADADWTRVMATRLTAGARLETRALGPWSDAAVTAALACAD
jgi:hypothetical protein